MLHILHILHISPNMLAGNVGELLPVPLLIIIAAKSNGTIIILASGGIALLIQPSPDAVDLLGQIVKTRSLLRRCLVFRHEISPSSSPD